MVFHLLCVCPALTVRRKTFLARFIFSNFNSVRHYQTEALLGLYTPKAERQGIAPHQDQTCPGSSSSSDSNISETQVDEGFK
ncbi:hypothetical protein EVAR_72091_1 [Eumeta japonica]|uniref:Uncharacterized protein n=1 Tax=Eumeta variegata TaxID=151549 RepID=A0A4C1TMK8_EUMVA|nr:hypothetical protein EVAR_72091_1 [Eumeta japonica]